MKKAIAVIVVIALVVSAFLVGLNFGKFNLDYIKPVYSIEPGSEHTESDINECIKLAKKDMRSGDTVFHPVRFYYNGNENPEIEKSFLNQIEGVTDSKDIIVIIVDYVTDGKTQALEPYSYYSGWNFVFYKSKDTGDWTLYTQGYA